MSQPNSAVAYDNEWPKENSTDFTEKLEKLNKVRESLFSQNGWSSKNVNQSSKWLVDLENGDNIKQYNLEMGTNIWSTKEVVVPCSNPDPAIFSLEPVNCLTECQCPFESSSHIHQFDANVFHDTTQSSTVQNDDDTNLTLHLRLETMNINVDMPDESRVRPRNSTNNFCQIPNKQPQRDCSTTTPSFL